MFVHMTQKQKGGRGLFKWRKGNNGGGMEGQGSWSC